MATPGFTADRSLPFSSLSYRATRAKQSVLFSRLRLMQDTETGQGITYDLAGNDPGVGAGGFGGPTDGGVDGGVAAGPDGGTPDAGRTDGGTPDAGRADGGTPDAGRADAGSGGSADAGTADNPDAGYIIIHPHIPDPGSCTAPIRISCPCGPNDKQFSCSCTIWIRVPCDPQS